MATLRVGPEEKVFRIHTDLIVSQSEYFKKAFTGHAWEESHAKAVYLEDASAIVVNIVVAWLYTGRVHYIPEHVSGQEAVNHTASTQASLSREMSPSGRALGVPEVDNSGQYDLELLVDLYVFADRYMLQALKKDLLPHISMRLQFNDCWLPEFGEDNLKLLQYIWTTLPRNSGLKILILDVWAFDFGWNMNDELAELLPTELWTGLIKKVFTRLPDRFCKTCVGEACDYRQEEHWQFEHWVDGTLELDTAGKEVTPFDFDMCIYHEHQDDAEREACKAEAAAKAEAKAKEAAEILARARQDERTKRMNR